MRGGGCRLNNQQITDEDRVITRDDFDTDGLAQIAAGKKRRAVLKQAG